jgi:hypothetical protein
MLRDTAACKSSTNYVYDFGGNNLNPATPRRAHSIAAQGGINAATRLINDRGGGISVR